jgi:hypothetical protein
MKNEDFNAKIMMYALQSLGFYAEIAEYTEEVLNDYGVIQPCQVLLTNADKNTIIKLFPAIDNENPEQSDYEYPSPVTWDMVDRFDEDCWDWRYLSHEDRVPDTIRFIFTYRAGGGQDYEVFVDVKFSQPIRYNTDEIICFYSHSKGKYRAFSNFYLSEMEERCYDGKVKKYASGEHYFQIMKAREFDPDGEIFKQMQGYTTCKEIKALGRKVQNFDKERWYIMSRFHMWQALSMKFLGGNKELKELLLSTGNAVLAEAAPRDTLWGIGYGENNPKAYDPLQWRGQNVLGKVNSA